jgi:group I intron endonuclease
MFGHWSVSLSFNTLDYFGFIYKITCKLSGKMYIGKKNFISKSGKCSNWRHYTSSSKTVNADIQLYGKHEFLFEIIDVASTPAELNNLENHYQITLNVLHAIFENGEKQYYNRNIQGIQFDTTGMTFNFSEKHKQKLSQRQQGNSNSFFGKHHTPEHKQRHSEYLTGKFVREENPRYGKTHTQESNTERRNKLKGKTPANKGKPAHNKGKPSAMRGKPRCKKVYGEGIEYESIVLAAATANLSTNAIKHRCNSPQFTKWYFI